MAQKWIRLAKYTLKQKPVWKRFQGWDINYTKIIHGLFFLIFDEKRKTILVQMKKVGK
jgi:hypothetical protein